MLDESSLLFLLIVIALAVGFDFVNGWTDACNAIATVISTRVMTPRAALLLAAVFNFLGALSGTAVAKTIGTGLISSKALTLSTVAAALAASILWSFFATYFGLPTSKSHELVAGLAGAGIAAAGWDIFIWSGWRKILTGLAFGPFFGLTVGLLVMVAILWLFRRKTPSAVGGLFRRLQVLSASFMAFSHGSNDAQKTMGVITMALVIHGTLDDFTVPLWVIALSAVTMAAGTAAGGWRVIRTVGMRITHLEPVHGFAAETSAALVIETASRFGIPLSTTHVISTSIMGVGASKRFSAVRWGVAGNIVAAWVLTFPACGILAWILAHLLFVVT